jgi:hypothetical protein
LAYGSVARFVILTNETPKFVKNDVGVAPPELAGGGCVVDSEAAEDSEVADDVEAEASGGGSTTSDGPGEESRTPGEDDSEVRGPAIGSQTSVIGATQTKLVKTYTQT